MPQWMLQHEVGLRGFRKGYSIYRHLFKMFSQPWYFYSVPSVYASLEFFTRLLGPTKLTMDNIWGLVNKKVIVFYISPFFAV